MNSELCTCCLAACARRLSAGFRAGLGALALLSGLNATSAQAQVFLQEISPADLAENQFFGQSLGANDTLFAVGSAFDDTKGTDAGAVYVFNLATGAFARKIFAPAPAPGPSLRSLDRFGSAVAVAGNLVAVSAPDATDEDAIEKRGAVYLFNISTGALVKKIEGPIPSSLGDGFGFAMAMAGDLLVIGAPFRDLTSLGKEGAIYIYNLRTNALSGPFFASTPEESAGYGFSLAVQGSFIAVGAPNQNEGGSDRGATYLLDAQSATPVEIHRFTATNLNGVPEGADEDLFGHSLAFARQRLIIGAPLRNSSKGKVYACDPLSFQVMWSNEGSADEIHGAAVAASNDLVVVGTIGFDAPDANLAGRVQVFQARDGNLLHTFTAPSPSDLDQFGIPVAISGTSVLVVAPGRDILAVDDRRGAVFKFSPVRSPLPFPEIALKNSAPPGAANTTFSTFNQLAFSPGGFNTFNASVAGTGAALGKTSGVWTDGNTATPDVLRNVRRTGLLLEPTPPLSEPQHEGVDFTNPVSNIDGLLGFTATTSGSGVTTANDKVFAVWDGATLTLPLQEGSFFPANQLSTFQPPRQTTSAAGGFANNFAAPITFRLGGTTVSGKDSGLVRFTATGAPEVFQEGVTVAPVDPAGAVFYGQFLPRAALGAARLTFATLLQSPATTVNNQAVFTWSGGVTSPVEIARKGGDASGFDAETVGVFSNFLAETNVSRFTFIRAAIVPPPGSLAKNEGIWSNRTSGGVHLALLKGDDKPPGLPVGVTIKSFLRFAGNKDLGILAWVQLQGLGITTANDQAILLSRKPVSADPEPGSVEILLREGFPAPGCGRARVSVIQALDAESEGSYVVLASLIIEAGGATAANNQALFLGNSLDDGQDADADDDGPARRQPALMLRKGMQFVRTGSPIIKSISLPGFSVDASGAMNTGLAHLVTTADPDGDGSVDPGPLGLLPMCSAVVTFNDGQTSVVSIFP